MRPCIDLILADSCSTACEQLCHQYATVKNKSELSCKATSTWHNLPRPDRT